MTAHLEITSPGGGKRTIAAKAAAFVLGSAGDADVQVDAPGVRPLHLRFVPAEGIVRVEPVTQGATVEVNGEQLFCKDLVDGDAIRIGALQIRWIDAQPRPVAQARPVAPPRPVAPSRPSAPPRPLLTRPVASPRSPTQRRAAASGGRKQSQAERGRAPRSRSGGGGSWSIVSAAVVVVLLCSYGLYRHFQHSTWPSSPQHYVDLARDQLANRQPERALGTLAFAMRDATGNVRVEAQQLEAEIRKLLLETAAMPKVSAARSERDSLQRFTASYLKDSVTRPAARELVRRCDQWLANYREVCSTHSDGKELLQAIESMRARCAAAAQLDTAEQAADVLFVVQERLALKWRDYKTALLRIDAFLQGNAGAVDVVQKRVELLTEGEQWLRGKLENIGNLLARADVHNARRDLEDLDRKSVLPAWEPLVAPLRAQLAAAR